MHHGETTTVASAAQVDYRQLSTQLEALMSGESDPLANAANGVALLFHALPRINWLGIYLARDRDLVLGPFQGKAACTRIALGSGVCGSAAERRQTLRVDDVQAFAGHIACDPESRSELVVPLIADGELLGVLDIDSPEAARFDAADQAGVERACAILVAALSKDQVRLNAEG